MRVYPPCRFGGRAARPPSGGLRILELSMTTNVYIDGYNLYYGALKGTPYKWLDLSRVCAILLPGHNIRRIRYFTARSAALPHDPDIPTRQAAYLRALRTIPHLQIHFGQFVSHDRAFPQYPLVYQNPSNKPRMVRVWRTEEKGSDVNLATYLLRDGFLGEYDEAVVISNDSDLTEPIKVVVNDLKKPVTVVNPFPKSKMSSNLRRTATRAFLEINPSVLKKAQFPPQLADKNGTFTKPRTWT